MQIEKNVALKPYNTFGIEAQARYMVGCGSVDDFNELREWNSFYTAPKLILGGGSNILFTEDYDGLVIKNNFKGIEVVEDDGENIFIKAGAGENWHQFVMHCVRNNFAGIENLSLIPGNVGASPMQNIGAYGVEIKDVFHQLTAVDISSGDEVIFKADECNFGYRESIFKNTAKDKFIITSVTYQLSRTPHFNTSYGAIEQELESMGVTELSIAAISQAVINIRSSKLPDPKQIGNAGSFFKNPVVPVDLADSIRKDHPTLASYPVDTNSVKLAAGWLIEQSGWKGKNMGNYGVHDKQALVLVNYGNAKGIDIFDLSEQIKTSVKEKFGVELEREVNII